jgi:hypothetical protein
MGQPKATRNANGQTIPKPMFLVMVVRALRDFAIPRPFPCLGGCRKTDRELRGNSGAFPGESSSRTEVPFSAFPWEPAVTGL